MKADLEYVSRARTLMQMKIRLELCKHELRAKLNLGGKSLEWTYTVEELLKEILDIK